MEANVQYNINYCLNCKNKPCQKGCPLGNDIPTFIKYIKEDDIQKAYETLTNTTVLGAICGEICPHQKQCEGSCIRGIKGNSVTIGELEEFVWKNVTEKKLSIISDKLKNKKIAVIGGGPCGLTCSAFLARNGAKVTIYEKYNELGGILTHGIPEFRLSKNICKDTINRILDLGIDVKYNNIIGKDFYLEDIEKQYDAIFLSFGANISLKMNIEGEELEGVYEGNRLLEEQNHPDYIGKKVAITGGGNVSMDCARTVKKLGAKEVYVIYRRAKKQMPAEPKEIEDAKNEGIKFLFQNNIVRILGDKKVEKVECIKTELVKKENEDREIPIDIEDSKYIIDMDYVVMAIGSKPDKNIVSKLGLETTKYGYIKIDENYMTSIEKVFAGGDLSGTKATVAWAARSGREAAKSIIEYLDKNVVGK